MTLVEVCIESAEAAVRAVAAGAARIELCAELSLGGLTPDANVISATLQAVNVPVHVMVRCRPGDFRYSRIEIGQMEAQADTAREQGAHGLVFGALDSTGSIDVEALSRILGRAGGLPVTFHRAFDEVENMLDALDTLAELGVQRILTSGGASTAWEGRAALRDLVQHAQGRIVVMAGGGVRPENVRQLIAETGVAEVHSSVPLRL